MEACGFQFVEKLRFMSLDQTFDCLGFYKKVIVTNKIGSIGACEEMIFVSNLKIYFCLEGDVSSYEFKCQ